MQTIAFLIVRTLVLYQFILPITFKNGTIQNIVFDVVAAVNDKISVCGQALVVALFVLAGEWIVGRETVVCPKFYVGRRHSKNNDAPAVAVFTSSDINEISSKIQLVIIALVEINLKVDKSIDIRIGWILVATAVQQWQQGD